MIAFGNAFSGLIVSSADVEIASNPRYAKNTVVAASITPENPVGAKLFNYEMKIYADGRLVCLERSNHTKQVNGIDWDIKGESPLIQYGKEGGAATFPVKLYLPQGSDEFVIIRRY